jgi:hypothetical protein
MNKRLASMLAAPDPRPVLVSVLGALWLLMSGFGGLRALIVLLGLGAGVQVGTNDPMAQLAVENPELVDPVWLQAQEQLADLSALERTLAFPLLLVAGLGVTGAVRLFRRQPGARTLLLITGVGAIAITAVYHLMSTAISLRPAAEVTPPPDVGAMFYSVALLNVVLQSLPVLIGMSLLRHPVVAKYTASRTTDS